MPRLVTKFKYLKPGAGGKSVGGYARYIATREGVEKLDDSHRYAPTTKKQQALIEKILRDFPEIKGSQEYEDFLREQTVGNASEFISMAIEENLDAVANTKTYADYIATRPRAERFGSHGLFTDEGVEVQLSKVSQELNAYTGNVYTAILSLKREDAARLGFDNGSRWRDFLRGQTQTLSENLKIPMDHLRWYAAFHNEGHHPHVHLIVYSTVLGEGHLSKQGMENIRSAFAREVFSQELLFTYQQQTEYRDRLREQGRESISDIVAQINAGTYQNPRIEELLIRLADRLSRTTGKKVYGYLKSDVKAIVDQIVAELAGDENIRKLYDLWYEQREDVLRTYTDTFPERIPLEQNKEFKSIRNAVIQEALTITPQVWRQTNAGQRLRTEEEQPFSKNEFRPPYPMRQQEKEDDGDKDSAILEEQRPTETVARILEDHRYCGDREYPEIIDGTTFQQTAEKRKKKSAPRRQTAAQSALRKKCAGKMTPHIEHEVLYLLNCLARNPERIVTPQTPRGHSQRLDTLKAELDELISQLPVDENRAREVLREIAAEMYADIDPREYETQRMRRVFQKEEPRSELDAELIAMNISSVLVDSNGKVKIRLKNDQIMERGE